MKAVTEKDYRMFSDWESSYKDKEEEIKYRVIYSTQNKAALATASVVALIAFLLAGDGSAFNVCFMRPLWYILFLFYTLAGVNTPDHDELKATSFMGVRPFNSMGSKTHLLMQDWFFTRPRSNWHSLQSMLKYSLPPVVCGLVWMFIRIDLFKGNVTLKGWDYFHYIFATGFVAIGAGVAFGYLFHLVKDSFDDTGVMWLYPISKKRYTFRNKPFNTEEHLNTWNSFTNVMLIIHVLLMFPVAYRFIGTFLTVLAF